MHILYAAPADLDDPKAHSIHIVNMCAAIREIGNKVTLVVCKSETSLSEIYGLGNTLDVIPGRELLLPQFMRGPVFAIRSALIAKKRRVSLVYTRHTPTALLSTAFGIPTMLELHSSARRLHQWMIEKILKKQSGLGLILITDTLMTEFKKHLASEFLTKLFVAPDAARLPPSNSAIRLSTDRPSIGYVGNLYPGKGIEVICKVALYLPEFDFYVIGGDAHQISVFKKKFRQLKNLIFFGRVPPKKVYEYINGFDIVLLPNQEVVLVNDGFTDIGKWTSPLKMFEYMASGKPIVASRLAVLQEVLKHQENAILVHPCNIDEWVFAIQELWQDESNRTRIRRNAHEDFLKYYTWELRASRVLKFAEHQKNVK